MESVPASAPESSPQISFAARPGAHVPAHDNGPRPKQLLLIAAGCLLVGLLSLFWADAPTYDPWSWLIWAREVTGLNLNTVNGPSWKPLPVIIDLPLTLFGDAAPALWIAIARASMLFALAMVVVICRQLVGTAAGIAASVTIFLASWWFFYIALGNSEGLMVALLLLGLVLHRQQRYAPALVAGWAAALLRPEVWPFLGAYVIWLWWKRRVSRGLIVGLMLSIPVLWFLPELWGSGDALRASGRAQQPDVGSPALTSTPAFATLERANAMLTWGTKLLLVVAAVLAAVRRDLMLAALIGIGAAWTVLVMVMTEAGYSGNVRYLIMPIVLFTIAAAAGGEMLIRIGVARMRRWRRHHKLMQSRVGETDSPLLVQTEGFEPDKLGPVLGIAAAVVLTLVLAAQIVPDWPRQLQRVQFESEQSAQLSTAIDRAGGAEKLKRCGDLYSGKYRVPTVAWWMDVPIEDVEIAPQPPAVIFQAPPARDRPLDPRHALPGSSQVGADGSWRIFELCSRP